MKNGKVTFADFKKFMQYWKAWDAYKRECKKAGKTIYQIRYEIPVDEYFDTPRDWDTTPEGYYFWSNLEDLWFAHINFKETERLK